MKKKRELDEQLKSLKKQNHIYENTIKTRGRESLGRLSSSKEHRSSFSGVNSCELCNRSMHPIFSEIEQTEEKTKDLQYDIIKELERPTKN